MYPTRSTPTSLSTVQSAASMTQSGSISLTNKLTSSGGYEPRSSKVKRDDADAAHPTAATRGSKGSISAAPTAAGATMHRQVIGNYELGRVLATGDFDCRTRLCMHVTTGVPYVVRVYDKRVLAEAQWMWERVAESIRVQRTLPKNKHVLEMVECFESNTSVYLLMHLFPSMNVTKLFTDATARAELLLRLHAMSRAVLHSSTTAATDTAAAASAGESGGPPGKSGRSAAPGRVGALHAADLTGAITPQGTSVGTPAASKRVSLRRLENSMWASSPPLVEQLLGGQSPTGTSGDTAAEAGSSTTRNGDDRRESGSAGAGGGAGGSVSPAAAAAITALGDAAVPSHVPLSLIRILFQQAVKGVLHLHQNRVVHTGIAPDHLLVGPDGLLRISNMVSCCVCAPGDRLHELRGTRHTVAPEALRGESYDPYLTDAWALGVVLYFMLNRGRYPHDGASTLRHILHGHVRPSRAGLPPVALDLVSRLLQAAPEERLPVDAILAHPFFTAALPTAAEEDAAEEEAAAQQHDTRHARRSGHPSATVAAAAGGPAAPGQNTGGGGWRRWGSGPAVGEDAVASAGASRRDGAALRRESLVSFGSDGSILAVEETGGASVDPGEEPVARTEAAWRGGRSAARSPRAVLPTFRFSATMAPPSPPASTALLPRVGSSVATVSTRGSVATVASSRPVWRPELAPTMEALEDLAARVIQFHFRRVQHRQQYRAETRALVARSQSMRRGKTAGEESLLGRRSSVMSQCIPGATVLDTPLLLELASPPTGTKSSRLDEQRQRQLQQQQQQRRHHHHHQQQMQHEVSLKRKSVASAQRTVDGPPSTAASPRRRVVATTASTVAVDGAVGRKSSWISQRPHSTGGAGVVVRTRVGSLGSFDPAEEDGDDDEEEGDDDDDDDQGSFLSGNLSTAATLLLETHTNSAHGSPTQPVQLTLSQRGLGGGSSHHRTGGSIVANSIILPSHLRRRSSMSGVLPSVASPRGVGGSVGGFMDRTRAADGVMVVKDGETCPLCHREPYVVRSIGIRPYAGTSYVYADGHYLKTPSVA